MIVMGTQGKTGADRFLLGGVTEKVVRHAKAEVLVMRALCPWKTRIQQGATVIKRMQKMSTNVGGNQC